MKKWSWLLAPAIVIALAAAPAMAGGKGGGGSLPAAGSGTIGIGSVDGQKAAALTAPRYQSTVAFSTSGTDGLRNPRVWVACYQSDALVYGEGGSPATTFKLGGDMSQWVMNGGGSASCTASLYYILNAKGTGEWNGKGAQGGNVSLAATAFDAGT
jgi:hypothetical protein